MLLEYKATLGIIYLWAYWPLLLIALVLTKDANVRWALLIFSGVTAFSPFAAFIVRFFELSGVWYHVSQFFAALLVVKVMIIYRPCISYVVGKKLAGLPIVGNWFAIVLPAYAVWKIFPAELALRRVFIAYCWAQGLAIAHYLMFAAGLMSRNGLFEQIGIGKRFFWDVAFSLNAVLTLLELLLLLSLVLAGCRSRWTIRA